MKRSTRWTVAGVATVAVVAGGGVAVAAGGEDQAEGPDVAITGTALAQASEAALEHLGEGSVTDTEVGDEEGFYEVEVTLDNGDEVDVHLDEDFNILGTENDGPDDSEDDADDE